MVESPAAAPWMFVCNKGCVHLDTRPASVFLKSSTHGAYTTTRTCNDGAQVLLWERHIRRLFQSMEVLASAMSDRFPHPLGSFNGLHDLVNPSLQVSGFLLWLLQTCYPGGISFIHWQERDRIFSGFIRAFDTPLPSLPLNVKHVAAFSVCSSLPYCLIRICRRGSIEH